MDISIEEISPEELREFWDAHIKYLVDDGIVTDEEDIEYFKGDEYRGILEEYMRRETDRHHMVWFVRNGKRIGAASYCTYASEDGKCFIMDFWVFPEARGDGTGHRCFEVLEEYTRAGGAMYYEINSEKEESVRFWKSLGFVENGADEYGMPLYIWKEENEPADMEEKITLKPLTRELLHELYREWESDIAICKDPSRYEVFEYDRARMDRYYDEINLPNRVLFAIMLGDKPIGELQLKQTDREDNECSFSIHMQNDRYKGKGYGTEAEKLAVKYVFEVLGKSALNADVILKNTRSQHVLEKVGFSFVKEENGNRYYRIENPAMKKQQDT